MASTLLGITAKSLSGHQSTIGRTVDALPSLVTNISSSERWASLIGGVALTGYGLTRGGVISTLIGGFLIYRGSSGHCPISQALGINTSETMATGSVIAAGHGTRVDASVVVNKAAAEVYRFWRDFENLPRFMAHLADVDTTTDGRSRWTVKGPFGLRVQWEAEIVADEPGRLIAWRSRPGSDVDTAGSVHFTALPDGRGTEVRVELKYNPPAGKLGTAVARAFGTDPGQQLREDLGRFREAVEKQPNVA